MSIKTQRELLIPDSLLSAENITYNNSSSGLQSETMQGALDELTAEIPDGIIYVDSDEETPDIGDIESITSAKLVSYNNTTSGIEGTNVQEAIDEINESKVAKSDIVDNLESTATELPLSANQGRVTSERVDIIESTLITGINLNGRNFNNLGEKSFSGQGGNIANGPIDNTGCNYIVHQIAGGGGSLLQFAKATNWGDGELLYFRQRRNNNNWDKWHRVVIQEEISQRWITQSTSVKGTVTIDVNPSSAYQLFCQWNGGTTYAIYYIDMENSLVVLTNGNQGTWEVTLSADKSKINISNENGNNQYAKYRLLRLN